MASARVAASELQAAKEKLSSAEKEASMRKAALDAAASRMNQAKAQVAQNATLITRDRNIRLNYRQSIW